MTCFLPFIIINFGLLHLVALDTHSSCPSLIVFFSPTLPSLLSILSFPASLPSSLSTPLPPCYPSLPTYLFLPSFLLLYPLPPSFSPSLPTQFPSVFPPPPPPPAIYPPLSLLFSLSSFTHSSNAFLSSFPPFCRFIYLFFSYLLCTGIFKQ